MLRGLEFQYMILDAYPESLIALGMKPRSIGARVWFWSNKIAYRRASEMVVLGRDMTTMLVNNYGLDERRIVYIPHWSAIEAPDPMPIEDSEMLRRLGLEDKFVVQYSGNMGMWHDMNIFVRAAKELEDDPSIHFLFIGSGVRRDAAVALSEELETKNVTWHDFVPLSQLRESLSCCHAALISLRAGLEGVAVPSKLYGILMSGRAIIAQVPLETETAYTIDEGDCGVVVAPDDLEGLVRTIREIAADPEGTARMGRNAFEAYRTKYTQAQAIEAFSKLWRLETPASKKQVSVAEQSDEGNRREGAGRAQGVPVE
jgi:glycosyltransferase involved in cell wall biosynthesis